MAATLKPRKCSECGKRRMPAKRNNGRPSTKCKECFGGLFWKSAFGRWFAEAAKRQSPDSMPLDEADIEAIHQVWLARVKGTGTKFEYHVCHRDPAKGDDYQGRFTAANLIVAPAKVNLQAKNSDPINHGYRVYTDKPPFGTAEKVRQWCGGQYKLNALVDSLQLKPYRKAAPQESNTEWERGLGTAPSLMLETQLSRFEGGSSEPFGTAIISAYNAYQTALVYGIGTGTGELTQSSGDASDEPEEEF